MPDAQTRGQRYPTLFWLISLFPMVMFVQSVYVFWPAPNGPHGVEALRLTLDTEINMIYSASSYVGDIFTWIAETLYHVLFVLTGVEELRAGESAHTYQPMVIATWEIFETFIVGLQIFSLRISVLVLSLPIFLIVICGGLIDGSVTWYTRRTAAERESGFIYHRAKRLLKLSLVIMAFIYLLPPVPLDPKYVLPPFLILTFVGARLSSAYFKKYL